MLEFPKELEPYKYLVSEPDRFMELVNGKASLFANAPLAILEDNARAEFRLLKRLYCAGHLKVTPDGPKVLSC